VELKVRCLAGALTFVAAPVAAESPSRASSG
jgi:hypothetical protein